MSKIDKNRCSTGKYTKIAINQPLDLKTNTGICNASYTLILYASQVTKQLVEFRGVFLSVVLYSMRA